MHDQPQPARDRIENNSTELRSADHYGAKH
jgi:hypothetical protein